MNNEAEMASVLGHEIGHVTARHSVTAAFAAATDGPRPDARLRILADISQPERLAETGLSVLMLKYSRDHERQSDQLGVQYMAQAGYDPEQMSKFFQVFVAMRGERQCHSQLAVFPSGAAGPHRGDRSGGRA